MESETVQKQVTRWDADDEKIVNVEGQFTEILKVGTVVLVTDEKGELHAGLVTAVHGPQCINAVYVTNDDSKHDPYGRQVERLSSLQKKFDGVTAQRGRFYEHV